MKQIIWNDCMAVEFAGYCTTEKLKGNYDAQKWIEGFKAKVIARAEPVKEDMFEQMANITRPANSHVAQPFQDILNKSFLQSPAENLLSPFTTEMDADEENEILRTVIK